MKSTLLAILAVLLVASSLPATAAALDTFHQDHRQTPRLLVAPSWDAVAGATPRGAAEAFLLDQAARLGLERGLADLQLVRQRESLLARHFHFQQVLDGIPVHGGEVTVSVAKRDGRVLRAYNSYYPVGEQRALLPTAGLDREAAYDRAWEHLRAHGDLRSLPDARLVYSPEGPGFRLNWLVDLDLAAPDGAWQVRVDALSGAVVEVTDRRIARKPLAPVAERLAAHEGPLADRQTAFAAIAALEAERAAARQQRAALARADGTGVVFDPDPRTTLRNNFLRDGSSPAEFAEAYFTRDLLDIAYDGSVYRLDGPWANILDWDAPSTPPSTTTDGDWNRQRGVNSFNDAMTYFHLDQNQRYMQSLGFVGEMAIQDGSISADTDGFGGADNSAYYPGSNRLTFGHGCVDDNEDADVILHEYMHAIHHDISNGWFGGDTGAIGEGLGDYWGGSYSYGTTNGPVFFPDYIFHWDGHGAGNWCWPGRVMNRTSLQYVHSQTYGAHQPIPGGISDELWSTPIFQAMRTLVEEHGETRESADTIVLESQFGLGSGLKMRDLANAMIATAQALYPDGPHAQVYVEKFLVHNIILAPLPAVGVLAFDVVAEPSGNGAADPGETVDVRVTLSNSGLSDATEVSATLTAVSAGVTVEQSLATFPDLVAGGSGIASADYRFTVGQDVPCGTLLQFALEVSYVGFSGPEIVTRAVQAFAGVPVGGYGFQAPYQPLPDNDGTEILSEIVVAGTGATVSADINLDLDITHDHVGDLVIWLTSPAGTRAYLHLLQGGAGDDIQGNYPGTLEPAQSFDRFLGEPLDGVWELMVRDQGTGGTGQLNSWAFYDISGVDCEQDVTAAPGEAPPATFALAQNTPNPFNPATEIAFSVPAAAGPVRLEIFDVRGQKIRTLVDGTLPAGQHTRTWHGRTDRGGRVASGLYFYRLQGDGFQQTRKMVVVQ